ncbi:serine hydrolase domain-containing protein [Aquimarina sp. 2201CG5-10]|uniref:serine hydrolase domain-containing protein n=1 Tax=Aquimarina callyspongiae TaxID=3098150 RepID=UPI002AB5B58B|nr:serine hydrolase domain-containing protein [Aquimarina sp. 2201CG5-10]MDY8135645.1 serine hydrolase domain-containing protein [Aquimarina sp. 2201CG5-10]
MKQLMNVLLIFLITFSSCSNDDDSIVNVTNEESLTKRLNQILVNSNFPGFTIGVIKDGENTYQESFGFQNLENKDSYSNQTLQPIGSISKTFIGVATVKAIQLGYFTLDTPINNILSEPILNPKNPSSIIRIKHLVNHTSGLIDEDQTYLESYYILENQTISPDANQLMQNFGITQRTPKTLEEFIKAYYYENGDYYSTDNFIGNEPGSLESYTNVGASLMAFLIEQTSGIPYQEFVKTHILDPLEMNNTSFTYQLPSDNYAILYFNKNLPLPLYNLESFPDGALKTSNEDIMKYFINMLKGQQGKSTVLFPKSYYELLFEATSSNYTIFWDIDPGVDAFGHSGGDPGLTTELHFSGAFNAGFFMLSNYDTSTDEHEEHYEEIISQINESINKYLSN